MRNRDCDQIRPFSLTTCRKSISPAHCKRVPETWMRRRDWQPIRVSVMARHGRCAMNILRDTLAEYLAVRCRKTEQAREDACDFVKELLPGNARQGGFHEPERHTRRAQDASMRGGRCRYWGRPPSWARGSGPRRCAGPWPARPQRSCPLPASATPERVCGQGQGGPGAHRKILE